MKKKRVIAIVFALSMMIAAWPIQPIQVSAKADEVKQAKGESISEAELAEVVTEVKKKINIPKEYKEFTYHYIAESSYNNELWRFVWSKEDGSGAIYVISDIDANLLYYQKSTDQEKNMTPTYLKSELKSKADAFVKKVASNISDCLVFVDAEYTGRYNNTYSYVYVRMKNDIPIPQQQITVEVDAMTGEVCGYQNSEWNYDILIPEKEIKVSKEEAASKVKSQITMNLVYHNRYTTDAQGNRTTKAYLVYEPSVEYIAVDARTGKLYKTLHEWSDIEMKNESDDGVSDEREVGGTAGTSGGGLTEEEINKIAELNDLITKQKAIEAVTKNDALYIDSSATVITASLNETIVNYENPNIKQYVWSIQWSQPDTEQSGSRSYTSAKVDAKTGEILSFRANVPDYYDYRIDGKPAGTVKYSEAQCQDRLEQFIKTQNKERFANTKLSSVDQGYVLNIVNGKEVYGGYVFTYDRVNEGIVYSGNQMYGAVDAVTGKVISYGSYWNDLLQFESPNGVMTPEQAFQHYIESDGFDLVYELNTISSTSSMRQEARLVYRTKISPSYISPFSGKQVNYDGSEYKGDVKQNTYEDIKNHEYYRSIQLITDMGGGLEGKKFNPDQAITRSELQQMVDSLTYVSKENKIDGNRLISKEEAACYFIKILRLDGIAAISDIYITGFADEDEISAAYIGAVALAKGLGLVEADDSNQFNPKANLTRGEAADLILKTLGTTIK